ncbi:MAG: hypothetical protein ACYC92_00850 [Candidatus Acidiferrales bacterium]
MAIADAREEKGDVAAPGLLEAAQKAVLMVFLGNRARYASGTIGRDFWTPQQLTIIARDYTALGHFPLAVATATAIPDGDDRVAILKAIAETESKGGDVQEALQLLNYTKDPIGRSAILQSAAVGQAEADDIEGALRTASQISDTGLRGETVFLAMVARANAKDVSGAVELSSRQESPYVATVGYIALLRNMILQSAQTGSAHRNPGLSITESLRSHH